MDIQTKLQILADSAKYDVSCSSSGAQRQNKNGLGNTAVGGICHSWSEDGRCISLLKILFTNYCIYNCAYCINRASNDVPRAAFTPEEVADLTINFYRRNYIEGLFLSSGIIKSPDYTMESLIRVLKLLREKYKFYGYIHLKAIPGASPELIALAGKYADRMSVNIELPSNESLKLLAPQKKKEAILKPMSLITSEIARYQEERRAFKRIPAFVPAGQSTQLIVGATADTDYRILELTQGLYKKYKLKRVYYSSYIPISDNPYLPVVKPGLNREHRLYQADWLLRFYGFSAGEILNNAFPSLDPDLDPKCQWAVRNFNLFPVEINKADYQLLIRVPGIGIKSAQRIVQARRAAQITYDGLKKIGVVLKRARYFITCGGKYYGETGVNEQNIRQMLIGDKELKNPRFEQLTLF